MKNTLLRFYRFHRSPILFWLLFLALYLPLLGYIAISAVIFLVIFWPGNLDDVSIESTDGSQQLVIISHGVKDTNTTWAQQLKSQIEKNQPDAQVITIDWSLHAQSAMTCAINGKRIGSRIANQLLVENQNIKSVHFIGHSCGSFVSFGACEALKQHNNTINVHSTFLAPAAVYGGIFWDYGTRNFGSCADSSETYFDSEDRVPGSNTAPIHSKGIDITSFKDKYGYQGKAHQWPIYYYIKRMEGNL